VLEVTKYRIDGGVVTYQQVNGTIGAVDTDQIDWLRTTQMTAAVRSVDLPVVARQTIDGAIEKSDPGCGQRRASTDVCAIGPVKSSKLLFQIYVCKNFGTTLTAHGY